MSSRDASEPAAPLLSREELVELVARAHRGAAYAECSHAGKMLSAQSRLPKLVAENLGAGFGQWDFFPEPADVVTFALAYAPPSTEDDLWALARIWAADDAAGRPTMMALVGRDVLMHELRRIAVPKLREVIDETSPARARELRLAAGLEAAGPGAGPKAGPARAKKAAAAPPVKRVPVAAGAAEGTMRMPKPEIRKPTKAEAPPPARRFQHPKFGEGALVSKEGEGEEAKLTIAFPGGQKTLLARYVTEIVA
jgi:hypothetical protein